jgi:hypothetical protein
MSCPTCDHTMQQINTAGSASQWYWCPRCGTIKERLWAAEAPFYVDEFEAPKLVGRCREFATTQVGCGGNAAVWNRLGIAESIDLPGDRS